MPRYLFVTNGQYPSTAIVEGDTFGQAKSNLMTRNSIVGGDLLRHWSHWCESGKREYQKGVRCIELGETLSSSHYEASMSCWMLSDDRYPIDSRDFIHEIHRVFDYELVGFTGDIIRKVRLGLVILAVLLMLVLGGVGIQLVSSAKHPITDAGTLTVPSHSRVSLSDTQRVVHEVESTIGVTSTISVEEQIPTVANTLTITPCIPTSQVEYLRYVFEGETPIPEDEVVEIVEDCNGDIVLKWVERLGAGMVVHFYALEGVEIDYIYFTKQGINSHHDLRSIRVGDSGYIAGYRDWYSYGDRWRSDGIVDGMGIVQLREWTEDEVRIIGYSNQFYQEAVEDSFIYFRYATDCSPSELRINGIALEVGPYGFTYKIPSEGGVLEAFYEAGTCGWYEEDTVRWSTEVHPGDAVVGTEEVSVFSMKDSDPWYFCNRLERMRPIWQPDYLPYSDEDLCPYLMGKNDDGTKAVLSREGFLRADTRYGDDTAQEWVPFVSFEDTRVLDHTWPEFYWVTVPAIELSEVDIFTATLDVVSNQPIISKLGGTVDTTSYGSDIPWYGWSTPLVFVKNDSMDDFSFDWVDTQMYRIILVNDEVVIQQALWNSES